MKTSRMSVKELLQSGDCGKEVEVKGWVRTKRGNKQVNFIALNDGSTINNIQVVVDMEKVAEEVMKKVTTGAAVHVKGLLVESTGSGQAREIQAKEVIVTGEADPEKYPIQPKKHSLEFLREVAHLRFRTNIFGAVFRIRHAMAFAIHQYFNDHGFYYLHTPLITASDCEGAGEMFRVKWIDVYHGLITVLHNRSYVCYILQSGFAQSILFANIASSPFIMQQHYGFSPFMFSVCFGINAIAIGIAAASAAKFRHPEQALYTGSIGMVLASVCLFIAFYSNCNFWVYETLLIGLLLMLGLTFTASNTLAMDSARSNAGIASALLGALGFAFGGLVSPLVGLGNILISTGLVFIIGSLGSFICTLRALNRKFSLAKILKTTQSS